MLESGFLNLKCEFFNCNNMNGKDYKRLDDEIEEGWENEPIFLCIEHGKNHEAIENQKNQVGLDEDNVTCMQEFKPTYNNEYIFDLIEDFKFNKIEKDDFLYFLIEELKNIK